MNKKISVIGSGSWGTALASVLAGNGHDVKLWSFFKEESKTLQADRENKALLPGLRFTDNIQCTNDIEYAVSEADVIVSALPSKAVRSVTGMYKQYVDLQKQIIVSVSKGLEADSLSTLTQVIEDEIPGVQVAALSGPSHAEEVAQKLATTNVAASKDIAVANYVQDLFMNDNFRIYTNPDILGVELGGSLKNIIALCAGIADGMNAGDNAKAALITRGMTEIARLGIAMGAHRETFFGLSGMGDLIVTCTSMHSRNRRAGALIGQGMGADQAIEEVKMVVEGVPATRAAYKLSQKMDISMPITTQAHRILFEGAQVKDVVQSLMTRSKRHEMEEVATEKSLWQ